MLRSAFASLVLLVLSGCVTYPDITQSRSPCRSEPGGWCAFVRDAAVEAYSFAIAATNAYAGDDDTYEDLGPALRKLDRLEIAEEDADKGFGYEIFEQLGPPDSLGERKPIARILAFRGTDFDGFTDIFYGTLRDDQIEIALRYFELERERWGDDPTWIVTGHSLGGALATEVSIKYPSVKAYMFNTSPFYNGDAMTNDVRRTVINERGEFLRRVSKFSLAPAADEYVINCAPEAGRFTKHKVRPLADCITWIAAYASEDAGAVVAANGVAKPAVECGAADKPHPGTAYRPIAPCIHQSRIEEDD
ncbi:alpha/beta hydrolase family protein [Erythrobacter rubeus]|uniref:Fungal lipase-like domain-containing protein n=1 Tax=Erythrobacter rubeus TaxID=2760803 RepID=A0ABR8KNH1_9SPHN|nr:hypothetical protein [Erythrobacter rubeus]MBD2841349.1 hypothetical protein [Erythrobacter rubeus]